jgi:very-short-patch-repair endonuclease
VPARPERLGGDEAALDALVGGSLDRAVLALKRALERRGVPGLACEVRFTSEQGALCYGDLWCPAAQVLLEVDGFLTHAVRERFRADRRRDRWMAAQHGVTTLRVDVREVFEGLDALADELAGFLLARLGAAAR